VLEKIIAAIQDYSWLVFTSSVGVNVFFDYLIHSGCDIRMLGSLKTACVGSETEEEVQKRGIKVDYRPSEYNGASLARGLAALVKKGEKLLIPRAKAGEEELTRILVQEGIVFDDVPVYEKTIDMERTRAAVSMATENRADFAAFTSSSAVECFAKASAGMDLSAVKAVCIGERTAAAAKSYGMEVYVSAQATVESMVEKIKELA
jgi:uroporphyrinogen III methyltransferase/synthase